MDVRADLTNGRAEKGNQERDGQYKESRRKSPKQINLMKLIKFFKLTQHMLLFLLHFC